jgi:hypothetical protein
MTARKALRDPVLPDVTTGGQPGNDRPSPSNYKTVVEVQKMIGSVQGELEAFQDERGCILDRIAYLESQRRGLAYPAHIQNDPNAQQQLEATGKDLDDLQTLAQCNTFNAEQAAAYLAELQARLTELQADDLQAQVNRLESEALQAYLSSAEHTDQARQARLSFESLWKQRGEWINKLQGMGRVIPDPVNFLQGDDSVRQAVQQRLRELAA